ncbi:MAG: right-handed parallel beta-helix repeat-containing protein [bacterium]
MRLFYVSCMALLLVGKGYGLEFYVDQVHGSDTYDGLTVWSPWKSLDKIRTTVFAPGDIIKLRRGQVWRETMIMKSSGAPGRPVTVRAYGDGPDPVLNGAVAPAPDQWSSYAPGIYRTACNWVPLQVFEDDQRLLEVKWKGTIESTRPLLTPGSWTQDKTNRLLYVNTSTGAGPETHFLEISKLDNGIYNGVGAGNRYTHYENILVEKCNQNGIYTGKGSAAVIKDCTVRLNAKNGILISSSDTTILGCVAHDNRTGFTAYTNESMSNLQVLNSCVYGNHFWVDGDGIRMENLNGALIENCHIYNHDNGGHADNIQCAGGSVNVTIQNCIIENGRGIAITNQAGPVSISQNLFQTDQNGTFVGVTIAKDGLGGRAEIIENSFNHFLNGIIIGHAHADGLLVEDNTFNVAPNTAVLKLSSADSGPVYLNRNSYCSNGDVIIWDDRRYTLSTFALFQSETGQDPNSELLGTTIEYTEIPINTVVVPTAAKAAERQAKINQQNAVGDRPAEENAGLRATNYNWMPGPDAGSPAYENGAEPDNATGLIPDDPLEPQDSETQSGLPEAYSIYY